MTRLTDLEQVLRRAVESTGLPGAAVSVPHDGEVTEAAAGVLNLRTAWRSLMDRPAE